MALARRIPRTWLIRSESQLQRGSSSSGNSTEKFIWCSCITFHRYPGPEYTQNEEEPDEDKFSDPVNLRMGEIQTIRDVQIGDGRDILDMERCELGDAGDSFLGGLYKYFLAGGLDSTPVVWFRILERTNCVCFGGIWTLSDASKISRIDQADHSGRKNSYHGNDFMFPVSDFKKKNHESGN